MLFKERNMYMKVLFPIVYTLSLMISFAAVSKADDENDSRRQGYEVTVQNLTAYNGISPFVVATHESDFYIFKIGEPASPGLGLISMNGEKFPVFVDELMASGKVLTTSVAAGITGPGKSNTVIIACNKRNQHISLAGMIAPSNDGFVGISAVPGPKKVGEIMTMYLTGYDSGSEGNTEIFDRAANPTRDFPTVIPEFIGTQSGMPAVEPPAVPLQAEGHVHVHRGIRGIGWLHPAIYDWSNPYARLTIKRVIMDEES